MQNKPLRELKSMRIENLESKDLKRLDFNRLEYDYFMNNCNFTDRQKEILDLRRKGNSILGISLKLYLSERTVNREIKEIKRKIYKVI